MKDLIERMSRHINANYFPVHIKTYRTDKVRAVNVLFLRFPSATSSKFK